MTELNIPGGWSLAHFRGQDRLRYATLTATQTVGRKRGQLILYFRV